LEALRSLALPEQFERVAVPWLDSREVAVAREQLLHVPAGRAVAAVSERGEGQRARISG
jgi:hypothetical protein